MLDKETSEYSNLASVYLTPSIKYKQSSLLSLYEGSVSDQLPDPLEPLERLTIYSDSGCKKYSGTYVPIVNSGGHSGSSSITNIIIG